MEWYIAGLMAIACLVGILVGLIGLMGTAQVIGEIIDKHRPSPIIIILAVILALVTWPISIPALILTGFVAFMAD